MSGVDKARPAFWNLTSKYKPLTGPRAQLFIPSDFQYYGIAYFGPLALRADWPDILRWVSQHAIDSLSVEKRHAVEVFEVLCQLTALVGSQKCDSQVPKTAPTAPAANPSARIEVLFLTRVWKCISLLLFFETKDDATQILALSLARASISPRLKEAAEAGGWMHTQGTFFPRDTGP